MCAFRTLIRVLVCAGALAGSVPATASEADDLIAQGVELRRQDKDQEALRFFQRALEQGQAPKALAQLGLCEQALGLWVRAEIHLQDALAGNADPWITKNATALHEALKVVKSRLGVIEIWGTPEGALVKIDGVAVGTLPLARPARAPEGRRVVTIDASGFVAEKRTIEVAPGATVREHVVLVATTTERAPPAAAALVRDGTAAPAPSPPSRTPPPAPPAPPAPLSTAMPQRSEVDVRSAAPGSSSAATPSSGLLHRWWFWAAVGGVALAGGVSAYFLFRSEDRCQVAPGGVCGTF